MNTKRNLICTLALAMATALSLSAQMPENSDDRVVNYKIMKGVRKHISIPDIPGYMSLKCDFHMHTVFADAMVSPQGRIYEAWYDGLDVVCVSEHIGVHKTGIEYKDFNLVNREAADAAKAFGMLVVPGVELTKTKPFGHMNLLFVKDASVFSEDRYEVDANGKIKVDPKTGVKMTKEKTLREDIAAGVAQGCFFQWNHPGWPDKKSDWYDIQTELLEAGHLNAMELFNCNEWYPRVLDYFDKYHIPMMANTDAHEPTSYTYGHVIRPMTLVFAEEYTLESLKEAMFAGRMVAFFDQTLAGDEKILAELVKASLSIKVVDEKKGKIEVTNLSDIQFDTLWGDHMNPVIFYPHTARMVTLPKGKKISFENCYIGRKKLETSIW